MHGVSPLGGNSVEATGPTHAAITDTSVSAVPLVWDDRAGTYISDLAKMELDDIDISQERSRVENDEREWRAKAGFEQT